MAHKLLSLDFLYPLQSALSSSKCKIIQKYICSQNIKECRTSFHGCQGCSQNSDANDSSDGSQHDQSYVISVVCDRLVPVIS